MKKIFILLLVTLIALSGCTSENKAETVTIDSDYKVGIWFSYAELDRFLSSDIEREFSSALENCKSIGVTDVFVHVRAYCDAIYPSELFPVRSTAQKDFDVLELLITLTHNAGMRFHAWINPYRVRTADEDIEKLDTSSPAYVWLKDESTENDRNVLFSNGIYLDPSSAEVRRLVIDGIRELLEGYEIDGIHFDDYFYPTSDEAFDLTAYQSYCADCDEPLSLADWRTANVNALISGTYTAVKFFDKELIFSVSPAASIEKNKTNLFADVAAWMSAGTVDWIIPQLYFGFDYPEEEFRFESLIEQWSSLERADGVRLMIGLGAYKLNEPQAADYEEWSSDPELLAHQTGICRERQEIGGHSYYSYTAMFKQEYINKQALESLLEKEKKYIVSS